MTTTTNLRRTDRHAPASPLFDPERYTLTYFVDLDTVDGTRKDWTHFRLTVLNSEGFVPGPKGMSDQCGHCGAHLRFAAVMTIEDPREWIYVGEECLDNRFETLSAAEFQRLRKNAELNRERTRKAERIARMIAETQELVWITYIPNLSDLNWSNFLVDMHRALIVRGDMSPAQRKAAVSAMSKMSVKFWEKEAERIAREAAAQNFAHIGAIGEKVTVSGKVTHIFAGQPFSYYGPTPYTYVVEGTDGIVKFTSTSATLADVESGDMITVRGTVKAHVSYRDVPQTVLTRVKAL